MTTPSLDITLRQLQYLLAVDAEGNLSAAARRCRVSQPALTEQLDKLESRLGKLTIRGRRSTSLTPLGTLVVGRAHQVLAAVLDLESVSRYPDAVRIGMVHTAAPYLVSSLMAAPSATILPSQGTAVELLASLEGRRIDAAILARGTYPPSYQSVALGRDELLLAVSTADKRFVNFTMDNPAPWAAVANADVLVLDAEHCLRHQVADLCHANATAVGLIDAASIEFAVEMVAAGLGVTVVPSIAREAVGRHPFVRVLRLEGAPFRHLDMVAHCTHEPVVQDAARIVGNVLESSAHTSSLPHEWCTQRS